MKSNFSKLAQPISWGSLSPDSTSFILPRSESLASLSPVFHPFVILFAPAREGTEPKEPEALTPAHPSLAPACLCGDALQSWAACAGMSSLVDTQEAPPGVPGSTQVSSLMPSLASCGTWGGSGGYKALITREHEAAIAEALGLQAAQNLGLEPANMSVCCLRGISSLLEVRGDLPILAAPALAVPLRAS